MNQNSKTKKINTKLDIDHIISLTTKLTVILIDENKLLNSMNIDRYSKICQQKAILLKELEHYHILLQKEPELFKVVDKKQTVKLRAVNSEFKKALAENHYKLKISIMVNKKIANAIKRAVENELKNQSGYGKTGKYCTKNRIEQKMPAISYNDSI